MQKSFLNVPNPKNSYFGPKKSQNCPKSSLETKAISPKPKVGICKKLENES